MLPISYLQTLKLPTCAYNHPNMKNPIVCSEAYSLLLQCHNKLAENVEERFVLNNTTDGCINISLFAEERKRNEAKQVVFQTAVTEKSGKNLHLFDSSTARPCPCGSAGAPPSQLRTPERKEEVFVYREYSLIDFKPMLVSISLTAGTNGYTVVVDFTEEGLPRLLPLQCTTTAFLRPTEIAKAVQVNGLGIFSSHTEVTEETDEFILLSSRNTLMSDLTKSNRWHPVKPKNIKNYTSFYKLKNSPLRRVFITTDSSWTCMIQYRADLTNGHLCPDISEVLKIVKPKFKREMLLIPTTCDQLIAEAARQNKILNEAAAQALDCEFQTVNEPDRLYIIQGIFKPNHLYDGEDWKNNGSRLQTKLAYGQTELCKVTTYVPRDRASNPDKSQPVVRKDFIAYNGYTFVFYHTTSPLTKKTPTPPIAPNVEVEQPKKKQKKEVGLITEEELQNLVSCVYSSPPPPPTIPEIEIIQID